MLTWVGENMTLVRRSASGERLPYWILGIGFVLGLAAHGSGFLRPETKSVNTSRPSMPMRRR
jgi:hypothetical protein